MRHRGLLLAAVVALLPLSGCLEEYLDLRPDRGVPREAGVDLAPPDVKPDLLDIPAACDKPADVTLTGSDAAAKSVLYGTVSVETLLEANTQIFVRLVKGKQSGFPESPAAFTVGAGGVIGKPSQSFTFKAFGVPPGTYTLYAWADRNKTGQFDSGDDAGYYDGTFINTIDSGDAARIVSVDDVSQCTLDFGISSYTAPSP